MALKLSHFRAAFHHSDGGYQQAKLTGCSSCSFMLEIQGGKTDHLHDETFYTMHHVAVSVSSKKSKEQVLEVCVCQTVQNVGSACWGSLALQIKAFGTGCCFVFTECPILGSLGPFKRQGCESLFRQSAPWTFLWKVCLVCCVLHLPCPGRLGTLLYLRLPQYVASRWTQISVNVSFTMYNFHQTCIRHPPTRYGQQAFWCISHTRSSQLPIFWRC